MSTSDNNNNKFDNLLKAASKKLGTDPETLKKAAQSGDINSALKNLNSEDAKKIQNILSNKDMASKLLSSPQAQQILKKLLGEK